MAVQKNPILTALNPGKKRNYATALIPHPQNGRTINNVNESLQVTDEDQKAIPPGLPIPALCMEIMIKAASSLDW